MVRRPEVRRTASWSTSASFAQTRSWCFFPVCELAAEVPMVLRIELRTFRLERHDFTRRVMHVANDSTPAYSGEALQRKCTAYLRVTRYVPECSHA